jgi:hypothetical protein
MPAAVHFSQVPQCFKTIVIFPADPCRKGLLMRAEKEVYFLSHKSLFFLTP